MKFSPHKLIEGGGDQLKVMMLMVVVVVVCLILAQAECASKLVTRWCKLVWTQQRKSDLVTFLVRLFLQKFFIKTFSEFALQITATSTT